ncbi:hypothetical protein EVAR_80865_1 [Eumeta japonica]|uniref:Uncharacterized protein n=1 Tax=Eumeta variegata TaxID=151549 RepID=A0A4C1V0S4_EUMVA|nr:hypothetical protein EVAR_80865_1 [Eumeta japonica]
MGVPLYPASGLWGKCRAGDDPPPTERGTRDHADHPHHHAIEIAAYANARIRYSRASVSTIQKRDNVAVIIFQKAV